MKTCNFCLLPKADSDFYKKHSSKCNDCVSKYNKKRYAENAEVRARKISDAKRAAASNPNEAKARTEAWVVANPEARRAHKAKWRRENKDAVNIATRRRRARLKSVFSDMTVAKWLEIKERYGNICLGCSKKKPLEADHIIPISLQGTDTADNIQPLCRSCNAKKSDSIIDFRDLAKPILEVEHVR